MAQPTTAQLSEKLRLAASKGQVDSIRELVKSGARFTPDKYGRTALHYAANYGQAEAVKLCVHLKCDLDAQDVYGCTALHRAVIDNHLDAVRALLLEGCAVDRQDENGNTALHEATWNGYDELVLALVKQGKANLHASNKHGNKPLHQTCQNGHNETTRILLRAGSHPNVKNNTGETPLHIAALFGHITCCRILISANANVNITNSEGNTALHVAAGLGKKKISKILVEASSDLNIKNKNGETALEVARKNDHAEVVMLILAAIKLKKSKPSHHHHHHHHHHNGKPQHNAPATNHNREAAKPEATAHHHKHKQENADAADGGEPPASRVRGRRELREQERREEDDKAKHHKQDGEEGQKQSNRQASQSKKPALSTHLTHQTTTQKRVTFVKEELRNAVLWEQQLHRQIHMVKLGEGQDKGHHHKHKHHQKCLYKDEKGLVTKGVMTDCCTCSIYIHKLQNQLEASKEKMLYEIETTRAQFQHQLGSLDKKLGHQGSCLDQLCKERVASERTECLHRIDRRMLQERALWSEEYERRLSYVRDELRRYFEIRLQKVQQQLAVYYPQDRRQPLHGNPSGFDRISEGTEDSSGSDRDPRQRANPEIGPSGRLIARRRQSPSPGRTIRATSVDGRLTRLDHPRQNGMVDQQVNGERLHEAYESGPYAQDVGGRSRPMVRSAVPRGRRTGSFTRAVQYRNASASPEYREDEGSRKELVSATYIPPIAHPDLPQSSQPREPESTAIAASFNFATDSSGDDSSSQSTVSFQTVTHHPVVSNHLDMQSQGSEHNPGIEEPPANRPFQRLSKLALEQKAQYESQQQAKALGQSQDSREQQSQESASRQQSEKDHSSTYAQLTHTAIRQAYGTPSNASTKSSPSSQATNQASPNSASQSSSQSSPKQYQCSNSSSGVSSGDAATASSKPSRRNPIDHVLIRALAMERDNKAPSDSLNHHSSARVNFPKPPDNSQRSVYAINFPGADAGQPSYNQPTSLRKTHELQI